MSTSPSRAPLAAGETLQSEPQPFPYARIAGADVQGCGADTGRDRAEEARIRAESRQQGLLEAQKTFAAQLEKERSGLASALAAFTRDRAAYFQKIEAEVVQLALAIARKILHREAQVDPLLLAGIVRVALEKIDGASGVVMRVHPQNAADWRRYLATHLEPADLPEIVEDPAQLADVCALETSMGSTELGLDIQLKEIEAGLMDLLDARPGDAR